MVAALFVSLMQTQVHAELYGSVTGSVGDDGKGAALELSPELGYRYNTKLLQVMTDWETTLSSEERLTSIYQWQSNNSLRWFAPARRISSLLSYEHAESDLSDSDPVKTDNLLSELTVNIPISSRLNQSVVATAEYEASTDVKADRQVDDWSGTGAYDLRWNAMRNHTLVSGVEYQAYDSGAKITTFELSWQRVQLDSQFSFSLTHTLTNENGTENQVTGGSLLYNRQARSFRFSAELSRTQTDAISFFDSSFDNNPLEQQTQLVVDAFTLSLADIRLTDATALGLDYQVGRSKTVTEIDAFSDRYDVVYQELDLSLNKALRSNSSLTANYSVRVEEGNEAQKLDLSYQKQFNSHWAGGANLTHDLTGETTQSWALSLTYRL